MGGNSFPLVINGHEVDELNFSINSDATRLIFTSGVPLVIMNGHMTTEALFSSKFNSDLLTQLHNQVDDGSYRYFKRAVSEWMADQKESLGLDGFCNWDVTTSVYIEHPELFTRERIFLAYDQRALTQGRITTADYSDRLAIMPAHISNLASFNRLVNQRLVTALTSTIEE